MKKEVLDRIVELDKLFSEIVKEELANRNKKDWNINNFATFDNFRRQNLESLYKANTYLSDDTFKNKVKM